MMCIHFIFLKLKFSSCAKLTIHLIAGEIMAYVYKNQSKLPIRGGRSKSLIAWLFEIFLFLNSWHGKT